MADDLQKVQETTTSAGDSVQKTTEVKNPESEAEHKRTVAERVIWFIAGIVLFLLAFRFLLSLLGANTTNSFANFIYNVSHPFVAPFFSLFSYDNVNNGQSHFEIYTLIAMLLYTLLAWGITKLATLNRD